MRGTLGQNMAAVPASRRVCEHARDRQAAHPEAKGDASRRLTAVAEPDAYRLRLLPDSALSPFQRLRDFSCRRFRFRVRLEFTQVILGPWTSDWGFIF